MARLIGPLFSQQARGTFGGVLNFQHTQGRSTVRRKPETANPNTLPQINSRAIHRFLTAAWNGPRITQADKDAWALVATRTVTSAFQAFLTTNLNRYAHALGPTLAPPPASADTPATYTGAWSATGGVGQITITTTINTLNDGWGTMLHGDHSATVTITNKNLLAIGRTAAAGLQTFIIPNVPPGTYSCQRRSLSRHGAIATLSVRKTVVVT